MEVVLSHVNAIELGKQNNCIPSATVISDCSLLLVNPFIVSLHIKYI